MESHARDRTRWVAVLGGAVVLLGAAITASGCLATTDKCNAILLASVQVDVVDSITTAPAAAGATVVLASSSWRDSVTAPIAPDSLLTAHTWHEDQAGPGTYSVTVYRPGYETWMQLGIRVGSSGCHVSGLTRVTARLRRTTA